VITLKQVIHYPDTNSVEATWVDSEGVQVKCHSYADVQMGMLREDLGADVADYEDLITLVESSIKPPEPADLPLPAPIRAVTPRQFRLAINRLEMRQMIEAAVAGSTQDVKDTWEFSTMFERDNALICQMAEFLGKTPEDVDAIFELAATL